MSGTDLAALKKSVRERALRLRKSLSEEFRRGASQQIADLALALEPLRRARRVALYSAIRGEVDTRRIYEVMQQRGAELYFPRVVRSGPRLDFVAVPNLSSLNPGALRILEPTGPAVDPSTMDVIVVPGVAFDRRGFRIGYGAGYYDRVLARYAGASVGIAYSMQLEEELPREPHDQPVSYLVCETGVVLGWTG